MSVRYAGTEKYTGVEGGRICYLDEGEGEPILMVHGLGGSMSNWAPTIERFSTTNRVIALDLPGHGKSDFFDVEYDLALFARVIRELLAQLGLNRVSVLGNSMGGLITIYITLNHPEIFEKVVLVDAAGCHRFPRPLRWLLHRLPEPTLKKYVLYFISKLLRYRPFYRMAGVYQRNKYTEALIEEAVEIAERPDVDSYLQAYIRCARMATSIEFCDRLGDITKPVLIVWGQKDMGLPLVIGQRANTAIRGSFLVAIPRAAHVPMLDQPELFNAAVSRFLSMSEAPGPE